MKVLVDNYYRLMLSLVSGEMEIWSDCSIVYLFDPLLKIRKAFRSQAPEGASEGY